MTAALLAAGDVQAFRAFFEREAAGLIRYGTSLLGSREDARDAAQEAFFRLWQMRARLRAEVNPARVLYTIFRNHARDVLRHRAITARPLPHLEWSDVVPPAEGEQEESGLGIRVQQALASLSPRQREVLLLRFRRQLTYDQIGAELGIGPNTASAHMQRALAHLRAQLVPPGAPLAEVVAP